MALNRLTDMSTVHWPDAATPTAQQPDTRKTGTKTRRATSSAFFASLRAVGGFNSTNMPPHQAVHGISFATEPATPSGFKASLSAPIRKAQAGRIDSH